MTLRLRFKILILKYIAQLTPEYEHNKLKIMGKSNHQDSAKSISV